MTRPPLVRQDTIDLQDSENPSAQKHPQNTSLTPTGFGLSQASALRHLAEEQQEEKYQGSPRVSADWSDVFNDRSNGHHPMEKGGGMSREPNGYHAMQNGQSFRHNREPSEPDMSVTDEVYDHEQLTEEETDTDGEENMDDDMMDKISASPSIADDDIDFGLVYALHTFVATVEGQANASKGDHMFLLDDTNSYWWLVKLVKDESIGYLPAEHIETPTERVARLNKHRNGTNTHMMLTDNEPSVKSKNSLIPKFRRRGKNVTWGSQPTFVEPPENNFSDEEDSEQEDSMPGARQVHNTAGVQSVQDQDEITAVEPLRVRSSQARNEEAQTNGTQAHSQEADSMESQQEHGSPERELSRSGSTKTDSFLKDGGVETRKISLTPNILREDSDNPKLKSVDSKESSARQLKPKGSLEALEKSRNSTISIDSKDSKEKKKERKTRMLGLFKRRERKSKTGEKDDLTDFLNPEKLSQTSTREDDDSLRDGMASPPPSPKVVGPTSILTNSDRRPSKLQKKSPVSTVAAAAAVAQRDSASPRSASVASSQVDVSNPPLKSAMSALSQDHRLDSSPLMQGRLTAQNDLQPGSQPRPLTTREAMAAEARAANQKQNQARPLQQEPHPLQESLGRNSPLDEIVNLGQSPHLNGGLHGWGASAANGRPSEDRIESSPEPELVTAPQSRDQDRPNLTQGYQSGESSLIVAKPTSPAPTHPPPPAPTREVTAPNSHQDSFSPTQDLAQYREHSRQRSRDIDSVSLSSTEQPLSKDPKRMATPPSPVSPPSSESSKDDEQSVEIRETYDPDDASERQTRPYQQGSGHKHQQYDREVVSLPSTESSSLMEQNGKEIQTPSTVNTSATWSDAGLREWFDGDRGMQEVRDLLVIIGDVNGVEPVDDDHPGVRGMFDEESKALENMNKRLDDMLDSFLKRKGLTQEQAAQSNTKQPIGRL